MDIIEKFMCVYQEDVVVIGVFDLDVQFKVMEIIFEIVVMIEMFILLNKVYEVEGYVFFQVGIYDGYGEFLKWDLEEMLVGVWVEVVFYKRDFGDFVLWKLLLED